MACCLSNSALQLWKTNPRCLFGWNTGKKNTDSSPQPKYHDMDLSFPPSLVAKTFLRGTLFSSLFVFVTISFTQNKHLTQMGILFCLLLNMSVEDPIAGCLGDLFFSKE